MTQFDWRSLLTELSLKLIQYDQEVSGRIRQDGSTRESKLTPELYASGWLGYPGATEEQITKAEARLGTQFPLSYREFLKVSNGWMAAGWSELQLWSIEEVDWFSTRNQNWIDGWLDEGQIVPSVADDEYFIYGKNQDPVNLRPEYLQNALEISSDSGDGDIYLLIPEVVFEDGEWEAWHFGSKLPGAKRYRSFYELMQNITKCGNFP